MFDVRVTGQRSVPYGTDDRFMPPLQNPDQIGYFMVDVLVLQEKGLPSHFCEGVGVDCGDN